jgi:Fe2+ transport system protein FeoA
MVSAFANLNLAKLKVGTKLRVRGYQHSPSLTAYRQKLLALGLTPNTVFTLIRSAPLGDPIEISVRNSSFIVRKDEIALLDLEVVSPA